MSAAVLLTVPAPATAEDQSANIGDPAGDTPTSFVAAKADVTRVAINWVEVDSRLTVAVTYAAPPPTSTFKLKVSSEPSDLFDDSVRQCNDGNARLSIDVDLNRGPAVLAVYGIEGTLRADPSWSDATVTYAFTSPALLRRFGEVDPFVCVEGGTEDDDVYGAFDGKLIKLSASAAEQGIRDELSERWNVGSSRRTNVRCLSRGIRDENSEEEGAPLRWCAFRTVAGGKVWFGGGAVYLDSGYTGVRNFYADAFPVGTKECGMTDFSKSGWLLAPFPTDFGGVFARAWARNTSCTTARRIARSAGRRGGYRCVTLRQGYEYLKQRCRRGHRTVWYDTGA